MEEGFVKGQSDNLPRIDIFTVMDFISSNSSDDSAKSKVNIFEVSRACYQDEAVRSVQVKREGSKCTVKCKVKQEHNMNKVNKKFFRCTLIFDENEGKVESVVCHICGANKEKCEHTITFIIWLLKRSEEPATMPVKCYWMKPAVSKADTPKFIKAKDFRSANCPELNITEDATFLNKFVTECKKRNLNKVHLMTYFMDPPIEMRVSLYYLFCKLKNETDKFSMNDFIQFCKHNITEQQCVLVEKATKDQSATCLWFELQYGRITASIAHKVSKSNILDDVLVEQILEGYQFKTPSGLKRSKPLGNQVRAQIESVRKVKIEKCGLFLSKEHPIICASADGMTKEHIIVIKCLGKDKNLTKYINEQKLTAKYEAQVQIQMHLANKQKVLFCIAHEDFETSKQIDVYEYYYNLDYCKKIIEKCRLCWKHIFNSMKA